MSKYERLEEDQHYRWPSRQVFPFLGYPSQTQDIVDAIVDLNERVKKLEEKNESK